VGPTRHNGWCRPHLLTLFTLTRRHLCPYVAVSIAAGDSYAYARVLRPPSTLRARRRPPAPLFLRGSLARAAAAPDLGFDRRADSGRSAPAEPRRRPSKGAQGGYYPRPPLPTLPLAQW
jgi:hypothetical protein